MGIFCHVDAAAAAAVIEDSGALFPLTSHSAIENANRNSCEGKSGKNCNFDKRDRVERGKTGTKSIDTKCRTKENANDDVLSLDARVVVVNLLNRE